MLKINVEPESVRLLLKQSRSVPDDRIADMKSKLKDLEELVSTWKGEASSSHKQALSALQEALENSQLLMTEILNTVDYSLEQFSEIDHDISAKFHTRMNFHLKE